MTKSQVRDIIVLDTSVILYDAECITKFEGYDLVVPLIVLDEIDKFRKNDSQIGRNARRFIRNLKALKKKVNGDYAEGMERKETGELIRIHKLSNSAYLDGILLVKDKNDDKIIAVCLELAKLYPDRPVWLSTKDIALNVKASTLGIKDKDYYESVIIEDNSGLYSGTYEFDVESSVIDTIYARGKVPASMVGENLGVHSNAGVCLGSPHNRHGTAITVYKDDYFHLLSKNYQKAHNIRPKNREQSYAMELLFDPAVRLVSLTGSAGTGKTLCAIACALSQIDSRVYDRLVISRPIQPLGNDLGFLPGDIDDKMGPWMGAIVDAVEFVFNGDRNKYNQLIDFGTLEIEPLTYIRGRSMPSTIFVLDESQNVSPHEMKTIITRIGKDSKIILTGDVFQIDNNYLDMTSNGLTYAIEKFKHHDIAGHVTFTKGQRSRLATLAAEIL